MKKFENTYYLIHLLIIAILCSLTYSFFFVTNISDSIIKYMMKNLPNILEDFAVHIFCLISIIITFSGKIIAKKMQNKALIKINTLAEKEQLLPDIQNDTLLAFLQNKKRIGYYLSLAIFLFFLLLAHFLIF